MPLVTKKALVCDRCGATVEVSDSFESMAVDEMPDGWRRIDCDRVLCPECHPGYELLRARHKVELEDYIANNE